MCSIIGYYSSKNQAAPILVKGLSRMEYRGYDSVGVATLSKKTKMVGVRSRKQTSPTDFQINVLKGTGKVKDVNRSLGLGKMIGSLGIGHTRWATHGEATVENAHPHLSVDGKIAIVHNGIIENYEQLKRFLYRQSPGVYSYKSETDSEIIANLLHWAYNDGEVSIPKAICKTCDKLEGDYSFIALFDGHALVAVKKNKPLIVGVGMGGDYFFSSDVLGFVSHTDEVIYPDNGEFVVCCLGGFCIFDFKGSRVYHETTKISKELADVYKGEYAHFTLKEIYEQDKTIAKAGANSKEELKLMAEFMKMTPRLFITGSGTSYHAGLVAKNLLTQADIHAEVCLSSETAFQGHRFDQQSVLLALSQSGESADVLDTVARAKAGGAKIVSIVNTMNSTLARESSICVGLNCGPEIGVAATKSFTSQLAIMYRLLDILTGQESLVDDTAWAVWKYLNSDEPEGHRVLTAKQIAPELKNVSDIYVLGRGIHWPIAVEAALKIKEITYIHAEGIAGGELKHGPLALMDENTYIILINPKDETYKDTLMSASQIKARGAKIIGVSDEPSELYDHWFQLPKKKALFPILEIVPIQILAYYLAIERANDPDYPRNLAKSVTTK
jgi:glucosamine--fructose-6-phosphate aminotransferase (isomerizing)